MDFHPKTASVPSSYFPRAPRKDKPPSDFQEGVHDDIIVGRGHSGETVGVEQSPRRFSTQQFRLTLGPNIPGLFTHSKTSEIVFPVRTPAEPRVSRNCCVRSEEHTSELQSRSDLVC